MVEKKSKESESTSSATPPTIFYDEAAIRNNFTILEYCRTCQSAASGIASGILGLTGAYGFIFYFLCVLIQVSFKILTSTVI